MYKRQAPALQPKENKTMITIDGKYTEARVFTDELEDLARTQIRDCLLYTSRDSWDTGAPVTVRDFTYNRRCELVEDRISLGGSFSYRYD